VVVDDELRAAAEHVGQPDGPIGADQGVVGQFHHRQPTPLGGDRIQFAGGGLLAFAQVIQLGAPSLRIHN
jgi:hypothetical protein